MEPTLGEKIKYFRLEKKLSQANLEIETDLAFGVISRIENDLVNPTKETILTIGRALELNDSDMSYLLSLRSSVPTQEDIDKAINQIKNSLGQETFPMYLEDNKLRVWYWNKIAIKFLGVSEKIANKYTGTNVMKILFSKELGILKKIPYKYFSEIVRDQVMTFKFLTKRYNLENDLRDDIDDLLEYDEFRSAWEGDSIFEDVPSTGNFVIQHGKNLAKIKIVRSKLFFDSRFLLIQYYPKDVATAELFERLRGELN